MSHLAPNIGQFMFMCRVYQESTGIALTELFKLELRAITGTVSVTAAAAAVVGVGTAFLTELAVGETLTIAGEDIAILSIADDENLVLAANHAGGAAGAPASGEGSNAGARDPVTAYNNALTAAIAIGHP